MLVALLLISCHVNAGFLSHGYGLLTTRMPTSCITDADFLPYRRGLVISLMRTSFAGWMRVSVRMRTDFLAAWVASIWPHGWHQSGRNDLANTDVDIGRRQFFVGAALFHGE